MTDSHENMDKIRIAVEKFNEHKIGHLYHCGDIISPITFKEFKNLNKKNQNLRDHMTDWELIFTMVGEKATTDITKAKDSKGFEQCKHSAVEGGTIAKNTRKEIEQKTGKSVVSDINYLHLAKKTKKLK